MKLKDLLNEELAKSIKDLSISKKFLEKEPTSKYWNDLGSGTFAIAYEPKKQIGNKVVKVLEIYDETDPSYQFLRLCKNHQNNPFFPRIYNVKQYKNKGGVYNIVITMEKLFHIDETNPQLIAQLFGIPLDIGLTAQNIHTRFYDNKHRVVIAQSTQYPDLKKAMRLMEPLFNNYSPDVHAENIMYRKTPNGPQLVFADPIN